MATAIRGQVAIDLKRVGFTIGHAGTWARRSGSQLLTLRRNGKKPRSWCWQHDGVCVRGFDTPWTAYVHAEVSGWEA